MNGSQPPSEQRHVLYEGYVQGVGFRYTAQHIAQRYPVAGFVRNLPDGRVELVAEGVKDQLDAFLADLAQAMQENIRRVQMTRRAASGEFAGFAVKY